MRSLPGRLMGMAVVAAAMVALVTLDPARAQDRGGAGAAPAGKAKVKAPAKGGLRIGVGAPPKGVRKGVADPLGAAPGPAAGAPKKAAAAAGPAWPFHATFKLTGADGIGLNAAFYPARGGDSAPVLLLVHQSGTGHSSKDFQEPIEALEGKSLAEYLQGLDYAVMLIDLRGHGAAAQAREVVPRDTAALTGDLHTAYAFLIDRHNRRELNLGKFGIIAVGDGANLVANWAAFDNGAVASPGRVSDLAALALISPPAEAHGTRLAPALNALATRLPMLLIAGDKDTELAKAAQPVLERHPLSKVVFFETRLQGNRLLGFEPKAVEAIVKFLDEPVKFRKNVEWEPRYLLRPIAYSDIQIVPGKDKAEAEAKAKAAGPVPIPGAPKAEGEAKGAGRAEPKAPGAAEQPDGDG